MAYVPDGDAVMSFADEEDMVSLSGLGLVERRIIHAVVNRLRLGNHLYGVWPEDDGGKDMVHEALEEALDGCIYAARGLTRSRSDED